MSQALILSYFRSECSFYNNFSKGLLMKSIFLAVTLIFAFSFATLSSNTSFASGNNKTMNRAKRKGKRIRQGVRSGELTKEEAKDLRAKRKELRQMRKDAKDSDGGISKEERKALREKRKALGKDIYGKKHNGEKNMKRIERRAKKKMNDATDSGS